MRPKQPPVRVEQKLITPQFALLQGNDGGVSVWQRQSIFQFKYDSVVHWITVNSALKLTSGPGATEAGIAISNNGGSSIISLNGNSFGIIYYDSAAQNVGDPTQLVKTSIQIDMKEMFVKSGTTWGLYLLAVGSSVASGQASISYSMV